MTVMNFRRLKSARNVAASEYEEAYWKDMDREMGAYFEEALDDDSDGYVDDVPDEVFYRIRGPKRKGPSSKRPMGRHQTEIKGKDAVRVCSAFTAANYPMVIDRPVFSVTDPSYVSAIIVRTRDGRGIFGAEPSEGEGALAVSFRNKKDITSVISSKKKYVPGDPAKGEFLIGPDGPVDIGDRLYAQREGSYWGFQLPYDAPVAMIDAAELTTACTRARAVIGGVAMPLMARSVDGRMVFSAIDDGFSMRTIAGECPGAAPMESCYSLDLVADVLAAFGDWITIAKFGEDTPLILAGAMPEFDFEIHIAPRRKDADDRLQTRFDDRR